MGKTKRLSNIANMSNIELGVSLTNAEESTSFIDDTDTSTLDSRSDGEYSSDGDYYLGYLSVAKNDKSIINTDKEQSNTNVNFDSTHERVSFGGPFDGNDLSNQSINQECLLEQVNTKITHKQQSNSSENRSFFQRIGECLNRLKCSLC